MEKNQQPPHEEYLGPTAVEVTLGKSKKWGLIGGLAGDAIGAIAGAMFVDPKGSWAGKAHAMTENLPMVGKYISGKSALVIGSSLAAGYIGNKIGFFGKMLTTMKDSGQGQAQFERIVAERDAAQAKLAEVEAAVAAPEVASKRFTQNHTSHAEHGSHTAAHAAKKEQAEQAEPSR